jgi:hypothetical protein
MGNPSEESVLRPEGIRKLLSGGADELSDEERALLVAAIGVELETGRELSDREQAALGAVIKEMEGFDVDAIVRAVKETVSAESQGDRETDWSDLKDRLEGV